MNRERSRLLKQWDQNEVWHPFTQMREYQEEEPLILERGEGSYLVDTEGNRYLDGVSSLWVNIHGHRHPRLNQALHDQIEKLAHSTLLGVGNVPSVELAHALLQVAPKNLSKVFYSDSGSTAVEIALKMAFQYSRQQGVATKPKTRFVSLENAYHGDTVGSVSVGGIELFHDIFKPLLFETLKVKDFNLDQARRIFEEHRGEIAAFIVEPMIQGAAGMRLAPPGFLRGIRQLCDEFDVFLICDEVATGFGRTGKMFAVEHEGVEPDFLCLAKGITGGYLPLAVTLTTERVFQGFLGDFTDFKTFFHGHSYTGNPLACAVALENLKIFQDEKILESIQHKIPWLEQGLKKFSEHPHVREVRQLGMMVGIELWRGEDSGLAFDPGQRVAYRVCRAARQRGALLRPLGDVLVVLPPLSISLQEIDDLLSALWDALQEVTVQR